MKKFNEDITIIIITYKSCDIVKNFIKKIPKKFKVIIVDNSNDLNLKKITKKYKNIKIFLKKRIEYYRFKKKLIYNLNQSR